MERSTTVRAVLSCLINTQSVRESSPRQNLATSSAKSSAVLVGTFCAIWLMFFQESISKSCGSPDEKVVLTEVNRTAYDPYPSSEASPGR